MIALSRALRVSVHYLVGNQEMVLDGFEFRKKQIASKKEQAQIQANVLHLIERYLMVEEILLALPSTALDKPREAPFPVRNIADADLAAQYLREHWHLGIDPDPNLMELLEERGIKVLVVDSLENIDGLTAQVRRTRGEPVPVIVVRSGVHCKRQRFSLAHELGHMVTPSRETTNSRSAPRTASPGHSSCPPNLCVPTSADSGRRSAGVSFSR